MKRFIQGNWDQIKSRLSAKYDSLTESDLRYQDGSEEELLRNLRFKLNMDQSELMSELRKIITRSK
ncbi:hypothetical protein BFP97_15860 [Roseivirga sp. 4D4]|nr:hypothetical protein BFP97_15860 [Roseivirga sp. 4D4]